MTQRVNRKMFSVFFGLSLLAAPVYGLDERVTTSVMRFESAGEPYHLVKVSIDPLRWDSQLTSEVEVLNRQFASYLLHNANAFLTLRHQMDGKSRLGGDLEKMILDSFVLPVDPFGRLRWAQQGRPLGKVDDYFALRSLTLLVHKGQRLMPASVVGTVKFVVIDLARKVVPLASEDISAAGSFLLPFIQDGKPRFSVPATATEIEYENLATAEGEPSPLALLLESAFHDSFFDFLDPQSSQPMTSDQRSVTWVNAQQHLVDFHRSFGFEIDSSFYPGLPANRLTADTLDFRRRALAYAQRKLHSQEIETKDSEGGMRRKALVPTNSENIAWEVYLDLLRQSHLESNNGVSSSPRSKRQTNPGATVPEDLRLPPCLSLF